MELPPPTRRRARPVATAPVAALTARSDSLAKGWLLALIEDAPLAAATTLAGIAAGPDGPALCAEVVRALADDAALGGFAGAREVAVLAGSLPAATAAGGEDAAHVAALRAVSALGSVVWSAIREELPRADADEIAAVSERLAAVLDALRAAVLAAAAAGGAGDVAAAVPAGGEAPPEPLASPARPAAGPAGGLAGPAAGLAGPPGGPAAGPAGGPAGPAAGPAGPAGGPAGPAARPEAARARLEVVAARAEGRPAAGAPLWMDALEREITSAKWSSTPLVLVLAALEDADRLAAVEAPAVTDELLRRFGDAVRSVLRRGDIVAFEDDARAWVIARGTSRAGGRALAERIAAAVAAGLVWRGAPMEAIVGYAVLGEDGVDPPALVDAAEQSWFEAAAGGLEVSPAGPGDGAA